MSNSVRFCKQIPVGVYDRFAAYAKASGMSERDAFIALVNQFTKKIEFNPQPAVEVPRVDTDPKHPLQLEEKARLHWLEQTPFEELSFAERAELEALKARKGVVYQQPYTTATKPTAPTISAEEAETRRRINTMTAEYNDLVMKSRSSPLDSDDMARVAELQRFIREAKAELGIS